MSIFWVCFFSYARCLKQEFGFKYVIMTYILKKKKNCKILRALGALPQIFFAQDPQGLSGPWRLGSPNPETHRLTYEFFQYPPKSFGSISAKTPKNFARGPWALPLI